jgi:tetratricopeptide (TPR) repeat protein
VSKSRMELLQELVEKDADDSFSRYGLAMEWVKQNEKEKAVETFLALLIRDPEYVPAYYQLAKTYEALDNSRDAIRTYEQGIRTARKKNDGHAVSELQQAMDALKEGVE